VGTNTLLTVPGRKSGLPRTTPVTIIEHDSRRYIQSPFGEVDWVRNLRASGTATLTRGRRVETVSAREVSPVEAAPVFKRALAMAPAPIRAYFNVTAESSLDEIARDALRHPMFELRAAPAAKPAATASTG
jgi:deazaflavin-dependent oxidoreductase (nitroreductase family)